MRGGVELAAAAHDDGLDAQTPQRGLHGRQGGAPEQPRVELARPAEAAPYTERHLQRVLTKEVEVEALLDTVD